MYRAWCQIQLIYQQITPYNYIIIIIIIIIDVVCTVHGVKCTLSDQLITH